MNSKIFFGLIIILSATLALESMQLNFINGWPTITTAEQRYMSRQIELTFIHKAIFNNNIKELRDILFESSYFDKETKYAYALHYSVDQNNILIARWLLENGALVNKSLNGKFPLHMACDEGHYEMTTLLLDNNAFINSKDRRGNTSLSIAARKGHIDIVKLLLEKKALVNCQNNDGDTALHLAVFRKKRYAPYSDIIKILVEHRANIHIANKESCTPYDFDGKYLNQLLRDSTDAAQKTKLYHESLNNRIMKYSMKHTLQQNPELMALVQRDKKEPSIAVVNNAPVPQQTFLQRILI